MLFRLLRRVVLLTFSTATIRDNFLYIDGGELNQIDDSSGTQTSVVNTQNTTLSIDLRSSWTNSSVTINSISKNAPVLNEEWLWNDPDGNTFYVWGGGNSPTVTRPEPGNAVWAFKADGQGGGSWSKHSNAPSSLIRTQNALVANSKDGVGYSIGGGGDSGPVQGMVAYNMASQSWTNGSTTDLSTNGTADNGQLIYTDVFGLDGLLIALDGADGTTGEVETLNDFSSVKIYDRNSGNWYEQATTGTPPEARVSFCAVVVHGQASMEIFIHGGFGGFTTLAYDDVYVLSLPSFSWYKAEYTPGVGRTLHTCNAHNGNMVVIGGTSNVDSWITGNDVTGTQSYKDPWPYGLGVFDMSKMQWANEFNPDLGSYATPALVMAGIAANGSEPATWSSSELQQVFSHTILSKSSSSLNSSSGNTASTLPSSYSSGLGAGAIAGIAVGAVAIVLLVLGVLFWIRRSKRRSRAGHNPFPNETNAYPMNYQHAGEHSPTQAPLIEIDGGQRPEKQPHVAPAELEQGGPRQYIGGPQPHEKMGRNEDEQWRHELP